MVCVVLMILVMLVDGRCWGWRIMVRKLVVVAVVFVIADDERGIGKAG